MPRQQHLPDRSGRHLVRAGAGVVLLAVLWGGLLLQRPGEPGFVEVPPGLIGTWETGDPRYQDRKLRITASSVVWGQGEAEEAFSLLAVDVEKTDGHPMITLRYGESHEESRSTAFFYDQVDSLYPLSRREVRWQRQEIGRRSG